MRKYFERIYNKDFNTLKNELKNNLKSDKKTFIVTANPETFMISKKDDELEKILLDENNVIVPDGVAILKASHMLGYDVKERITGIDIAYELLDFANELNKSLYLFGAKEEVIDGMKEVIKDKYPNIKLVGTENGYVKDKDGVFNEIIKLNPDIVMVALGIPAQEKLINKHLSKFNKGIFIGVGGSFDVISGSKKRAPKIFIKLNLEWLYRIACEPKRLKRFWNSNVKFILNVRKYK